MKTNRLSAIIVTMIFATTVLTFYSCDKEEVSDPENPVITSVSPEIATEGTEVTITGTEFTTDGTKLTITVEGIAVIPTSITITEIKFVVPEGLSIGEATIIVKIEGRSEDATATITIDNNDDDLWEWTKVGTSNIEWFESPIVAYDNKLWQIAGDRWDENLDTYIFTNNVYNSTDGITWNLVNDNPGFSERALNRTIVYNEKLMVVGGVQNGGGEENDVWSSSDGVEWTMESSNQFHGRERFGLVEFDNFLWIFGGDYYDFDVEGLFFTGDIFKSANGKNWEEVILESDNHPIARIDFFTYVFDDKLWVVSGNSNLENPDVKSDIWNTTDGKTWNLVYENGLIGEIGNMISMNSLVFDDKMWILHNGKAYYSVDGKDWIKINDEANTWDVIDAVVFNNSIYVFVQSGDIWQLKKK